MLYTWKKTDVSIYRAIYANHESELAVFESYTENCSETGALKAQDTAWGFKDAETPIIKSRMRNFNEWEYFLVHKVTSDD